MTESKKEIEELYKDLSDAFTWGNKFAEHFLAIRESKTRTQPELVPESLKLEYYNDGFEDGYTEAKLKFGVAQPKEVKVSVEDLTDIIINNSSFKEYKIEKLLDDKSLRVFINPVEVAQAILSKLSIGTEKKAEVEQVAKSMYEICTYPNPFKWGSSQNKDRDIWMTRASILCDDFRIYNQAEVEE